MSWLHHAPAALMPIDPEQEAMASLRDKVHKRSIGDSGTPAPQAGRISGRGVGSSE